MKHAHPALDHPPEPRSTAWLLLRRTTLRHWRRSWKETVALLLLLSAGVAAFLAIRMANRAAVISFEQFTQNLTGQTDGIVRSTSGQLTFDDLERLRELAAAYPILFIPVLEAYGSLAGGDNGNQAVSTTDWVQLVGLDLLGIQNLPEFQQRENRLIFGRGEGEPIFEILSRRKHVYTHRDWAEARGHKSGDTFTLLIDDRAVELTIAGFIPEDPGSPQVPTAMMIMDLPSLQLLTGRADAFSRVEWLVEPGPRASELRAAFTLELEENSPGHWLPARATENRDQGAVMTRAFRLNLTILSLIALLVGVYLILQALEAAVVQRRPEIAILRSLGVTPRSIRRAWLGEALLLGAAGSVLGILMGWAGAQFSVRAVAETVNALYQASTAQAARLTPSDVSLGFLLGCGASLLAGWIPAREAARTPPAQLLVRGYIDPGIPLLNRTGLGWLLLAAGFVLSLLPAVQMGDGVRFPVFGYLAALAWLLGGTLLLGPLIRAAAYLAARLLRSSPPGFLATARLRRPSGRHKLAAAGLLVALAMAHAMAILVNSFEHTMRDWIEHTLQADLYIASAANQTASSQARIRESTAAAIAGRPEVERAEFLQAYLMRVDGLETRVSGVELASAVAQERFRFLSLAPDVARRPDYWDASPSSGIVSESFARRFSKKVNDTVILDFPVTGSHEFAIKAIFADYGNERGALLIPGKWIAEGFGNGDVTSIALTLTPGTNPEQVRLKWSREFPALQIQSNRALRAEVMRIFRQTFSITYALKIIALLVASLGLGLGLYGLILEYRADLTTLRALGMRRRELARVTAWEGTILAATAASAGIATSLLLGHLLIYVINRQSFGWTLAYALPWIEILAFTGSILFMGALVSWISGLRGAALPADHEE